MVADKGGHGWWALLVDGEIERTRSCPGAATAVMLASWRPCGDPLLRPGELNTEVATRYPITTQAMFQDHMTIGLLHQLLAPAVGPVLLLHRLARTIVRGARRVRSHRQFHEAVAHPTAHRDIGGAVPLKCTAHTATRG